MDAIGEKNKNNKKNKYGVERLTTQSPWRSRERTPCAAPPGCAGPHQGGACGGASLATCAGHQHQTLLCSPQKMGCGFGT